MFFGGFYPHYVGQAVIHLTKISSHPVVLLDPVSMVGALKISGVNSCSDLVFLTPPRR